MIDDFRAQLGQVSWTARDYASRERLRRQVAVVRSMRLPRLPRRRRQVGEVWAVAMVRDEIDVIGATVDHLLEQGVDRVAVVDNGSVDGTRELLERRSAQDGRLVVGTDPLVPYFQSEKMTWLAHLAWRGGADWVIPFDADEWWFAASGRLAEHLRQRPERILYAHLHHMVPCTADPEDLTRAEFVLDSTPGQVGKVAFRSHPLARVERGNHAVSRVGEASTALHIAHAIYRGPGQVLRKVRQGSEAAALTGDDTTEITPHWASANSHSDADVARMWETISRGGPEPRLGFDAVGPMVHVRPGAWRTWDPDGVVARARRVDR